MRLTSTEYGIISPIKKNNVNSLLLIEDNFKNKNNSVTKHRNFKFA